MNDEPLPREVVRILDDRDRFMAKHGLLAHQVHIALGFRLWSKWRAFLERQGVPHVTLLFGSPVRRNAEIHHDSWLVTGDAVAMFGAAARRTQDVVERARTKYEASVAEDRERLREPTDDELIRMSRRPGKSSSVFHGRMTEWYAAKDDGGRSSWWSRLLRFFRCRWAG